MAPARSAALARSVARLAARSAARSRSAREKNPNQERKDEIKRKREQK